MTKLLEQAQAELTEIATKREKAQLAASILMTVGEFSGCIFLLCHESDWFSLYLAFTYFIRETRGGVKYHALLTVWCAKLRRRRDLNDLKAMREDWVRGGR